MSEQIAQLKSFDNYVVRNDLLNSDTNNIVERSKSELQRCREEIQRLSKQNYYEQFKENFQSQATMEVPEDVIEELTNKFTVKNFKEDIKSVFPLIYKLMQEQSAEDSGLGYDDVVEMTQLESINDEAEISEDQEDEFDKFESWVMNLGEASPIQSSDDDEKSQAIQKLNDLTKDHFPAGVDGQNAIQSLKVIIEDPVLDKEIKAASKEDADTCIRPIIKAWLEVNAQDVLDQIDFGDMTEEDADQAPQEAEQEEQPQQQSGMRELAEFINSFYDKESGTFPKGPEGVVTMVGKKFGEQAENVARKFVERMAPQQATDQNPELAELAQDNDNTELDRIKSLAGF
jgi:hypothetical protein